MEKSKEWKSNANYFQKSDALRWIGIGLLVLSGVSYFLGVGFVSYVFMCVGLPLGVIFYIVSTFGRSDEDDIDDYIRRRLENVGYPTDDPLEIEKK